VSLNSKKITGMVVLFSATIGFALWVVARMAPESTPVARGAEYAEVRGCVDCHGQPGNPAADTNDFSCSHVNKMSWHPQYEVNCTDVMAYFETVRLRRSLEERQQFSADNVLLAGEQLAREYHCFNCHGHLGQGGFKNAKSFKGYVPGYFGDDFKILTSNGDRSSVRQWIMHGMDPSILDAPLSGRVAEFFFNRQAVSMPSFKSLDAAEIEVLVDYVIALNGFGPMTAKTVRLYGEQSVVTESPVVPGSLQLANKGRNLPAKKRGH
jgi:cytochrome c553